MCIACSPFCGHCRPPTKKAVDCPECETLNVFDIKIQEVPIKRYCRECGSDLTEPATPQIVRCRNTGLLCANPCGYHLREPNGRDCRSNTPPPTACKAVA